MGSKSQTQVWANLGPTGRFARNKAWLVDSPITWAMTDSRRWRSETGYLHCSTTTYTVEFRPGQSISASVLIAITLLPCHTYGMVHSVTILWRGPWSDWPAYHDPTMHGRRMVGGSHSIELWCGLITASIITKLNLMSVLSYIICMYLCRAVKSIVTGNSKSEGIWQTAGNDFELKSTC